MADEPAATYPVPPVIAPPDWTSPDSVTGGLLRHALTATAGWLASHGVLQGSQIEAFVGIVIGIAAFAWSYYNKRQTTKALAVALALPRGADRTQLDRAVAVAPAVEAPPTTP